MDLVLLVHEYALLPPRPNLDFQASPIMGIPTFKAPVLIFYGRTQAGTRVTLHVHGVPTSIIISDAFLSDFAHRIQTQFPQSYGPVIHDVTVVSGTSFYGYHSRPCTFLKLQIYDKSLVKELMKIVSSGVLGVRLQPYEAHIDVFQHFYAEFNIRGMDTMRVTECVYRKPLPIDLFPENPATSDLPKETPSPIEADCLCVHISKVDFYEMSQGRNIEIPSMIKLWQEQARSHKEKKEEFAMEIPDMPLTTSFPHDFLQDSAVLNQFLYLRTVGNEGKETLAMEGEGRLTQGGNEDDEKLIDDLLDISKPKALVTREKTSSPSITSFLNPQTPDVKAQAHALLSTDERFSSDEIRAFYHSSYGGKTRPEPTPNSVYPQLHLSISRPEIARGVINKELLDLAEEVKMSETPMKRPYEISPCTEASAIKTIYPAQDLEPSYLTFMYLELVPITRADLSPDPAVDGIAVVVYKTVDDFGQSIDRVIAVRGSCPSLPTIWGTISHHIDWVDSEEGLFSAFCKAIETADPDVIIGFDIVRESLGYMLDRAKHIRFKLPSSLTRFRGANPEVDRKKKKKFAGKIYGRIVIDGWRMVKEEVKVHMHSFQNLVYHVLGLRLPKYRWYTLSTWLQSVSATDFARVLDYFRDRIERTKAMIDHYGIFSRATQLAKIYGIDLLSVFMRGSQFRVEAILKRYCLYNTDYLLLSATQTQVAGQRDLEAIPLVLEPPKAFANDPVVVLDFQSLYPSIMIAYNLCYTTCLGKLWDQAYKQFGVAFMKGESFFGLNQEDIHVTPSNVGFLKPHFRVGVLPKLMHVLLQTRIMTKRVMKKTPPGSSDRSRLMNQQLGIKMLCNTTYGYTGAGMTGRMPCSDLADAIVSLARRTLETAQRVATSQESWGAEVIYGDTDSLMIKFPGKSVAQAFALGKEVVKAINERNPAPIEILLEKVYCPFISISKKHYAGYKYETPESSPELECKGIETVRRDNCQAVSLIQEKVLRLLFKTKDLYQVYEYLTRQWNKIMLGQVRLGDFIIYKKVLLGSYKVLPHAAIVSEKLMEKDRMAVPHYGERVGYVIVSVPPGSPIKEGVVSPADFLRSSNLTLNVDYYLNHQILPVLSRLLEPVGIRVQAWFDSFPRKKLRSLPPTDTQTPTKSAPLRLDQFYQSSRCFICNELGESNPCEVCRGNTRFLSFQILSRLSETERQCAELTEVCRTCMKSGVGDIECVALECPIFSQRTILRRNLQSFGPSLSREVRADPMINAYLV